MPHGFVSCFLAAAGRVWFEPAIEAGILRPALAVSGNTGAAPNSGEASLNTRTLKKLRSGLVAAATLFAGSAAFAAQPEPWQWRFQPPATDMMAQIEWFEVYTLWFIIPITLLVLALLAWCIIRFRASANPTPSRTSHNTTIEVIWTVGPVVVLLLIAIPSFQLLTSQYTPPEEPKLTLKATGNQWNWDYEYQIEDPLSFNSALLQENERSAAGKEDVAAYPRLLAVHNESAVKVEVVTGMQKFQVIGHNTYNTRLTDALVNRDAFFALSSAIAASVPVWRIRRPRRIWTAEQIADRIEGLLG